MKSRGLLTVLLVCFVCFSVGCGSEEAQVYYKRGVAKAKRGKYKAAIEEYNAAIRLDPNYAVALRPARVRKETSRQIRSSDC